MLELNQLRLKRGKIVQEIIKGIKTIKFSVWERYIYQKLRVIRKDEQSVIKRYQYYQGIDIVVNHFMPTVSGLVCFWLYSFFYEPLPTSKIFSTLALFTNLSYPIRYYMVANNFRIKSDLSDKNLADLIELEGAFEQKDDPSIPLGEIRIETGCFRWVDENLERKFTPKANADSQKNSKITQIDIPKLVIKPGKFTTIIGKVGSGKTFLLHAIMNELVTVAGTTRKHGRIAYIP